MTGLWTWRSLRLSASIPRQDQPLPRCWAAALGGYHELATVFQALDMVDHVTAVADPGTAVQLEIAPGSGRVPKGGTNLAQGRAACSSGSTKSSKGLD